MATIRFHDIAIPCVFLLPTYLPTYQPTSVTRMGDFLDFGQLFKAFGNN